MAGTKPSVSSTLNNLLSVQVSDWLRKSRFVHWGERIEASSSTFLILKISDVPVFDSISSRRITYRSSKEFGCGGLSDFKTTLVHLKGCRKITHSFSKNSIFVATLLSHTCIQEGTWFIVYRNCVLYFASFSFFTGSLLNHVCIFEFHRTHKERDAFFICTVCKYIETGRSLKMCFCGVWESPDLERSNLIGISEKQGTCSRT